MTQNVTPSEERDSCGDPCRISRKSRQMVRIRPETTVDQFCVADYPSELSSGTPGLIWVKCSHPVVPTGLETALKTVGYDVHCGHKAPGKDIPSSIIYCSAEEEEEEDVGLEIRALRALCQDAPILVLCMGADPESVLAALQAGACGFIWRQPAESICALSAASEGDTVITRGLLEALLVERASHEDSLSPHQRGIIFELAVTASMSSEGALRLPKKLLEAFLGEVMIA
jgi:hypothetical protein